MNLSFTVQALSSTVANVLRNCYGQETHDTETKLDTKLCEYMDK